MLPDEVFKWLLTQGPAGVIILCLLLVIIYLFKRWDSDRDKLIEFGVKNAELALTCAEVVKTANSNAVLFVENMQTFKLLTDLERRERK